MFDEAGMTLPAAALTHGQIALQKLGYRQPYADADHEVAEENLQPEIPCFDTTVPMSNKPVSTDAHHLKVKCLSHHATIPTRATNGAAG